MTHHHPLVRRSNKSIRQPIGAMACLLAATLGWASSVIARVEIVLGDGSSAYSEARAELASQLTGIDLVVAPVETVAAPRRTRPPDIVVALGSEALRAVGRVREEAPIVALLVTRDTFDRARDEVRTAGSRRSMSGVYLDQPWSRQIALVRLVVPERRRIGLLSTEGLIPQLSTLDRIAREQKALIVHELVESPQTLHVGLMRIVGTADVLLAVPDNRVFNASTIQHILLTTFRARLPVIGFSPAYVQAGALAAVYSTPSQMAREAAAMVQRHLTGQSMPGGQYPRAFTVSVNRAVARSLDMNLHDEATLAKQLDQLERDR
jgi:putative tryptophan/tyrosine transport system substrate-binding protein